MSLTYQFERLCAGIRHNPALKSAMPLWNAVRPLYESALRWLGREGLERRINGTDTIRLCTECRVIGETYEPEVWARVMANIGPGSKVIDVGAHWGLYALAMGERVRPNGNILAAEPDPSNLELLRHNIRLNHLQEIVSVVPAALSDHAGKAMLSMNSLQSNVTTDGTIPIEMETLDAIAGTNKWHLLLIDVEGHEELVLRGARSLLSDPLRRPELIVIEVHPYAWSALGLASESLLGELRQHGYAIEALSGEKITTISAYGHIVAIAM